MASNRLERITFPVVVQNDLLIVARVVPVQMDTQTAFKDVSRASSWIKRFQ